VSLVGKDKLAPIACMSELIRIVSLELTRLALRESVKIDNDELESRLQSLQEELTDLKERDRLHLAEIKKYVLPSRSLTSDLTSLADEIDCCSRRSSCKRPLRSRRAMSKYATPNVLVTLANISGDDKSRIKHSNDCPPTRTSRSKGTPTPNPCEPS
jgi:hypothetical protein